MKKKIENTIEADTYRWNDFNQWCDEYGLTKDYDKDSFKGLALWECWKTAYQTGFNKHDNAKSKRKKKN